MPYTMRDLSERSGVAPRTLRSYAMEGLIPRADGHGPGATYSEEHMVRAIAIGRMRARGMRIDRIIDEVDGWSTARFAKYVAETEPPVMPVPPARDAESPVKSPEPQVVAAGGALPDAPAWSIYPLLSGMSLMVDIDAPEAVRRLASEILEKYGPRRTPRG